jgi:hypothetical protein
MLVEASPPLPEKKNPDLIERLSGRSMSRGTSRCDADTNG